MTRHIPLWLTHGVTDGVSHRWPISLIVVFSCIFAALFLAAVMVIAAVRPDDRARRLAERIERYQSRQVPRGAETILARVAGRWVSPVLRLGNVEPRLALRLDLAGIGRTPGEWVLAGGCVSVVLALLLTALSGSPVIGAVVGGLAGWLAMRLGLNFRIRRRRARFSEQLPDLLQFLAGSLRAGFSLAQGWTRRCRRIPSRRPASSPAHWRNPAWESKSRMRSTRSRTGWSQPTCGGR
jgi:tight adherence protein B